MKSLKIVVLAGGLSTERTVSLATGTEVCRALRSKGHKAILVDMFLGLESYSGTLDDIFDVPDGLCGEAVIHASEPDLEQVRAQRKDQSASRLGKDVLTVCGMADAVFLALHGACGEDGRIQATFDLLGIPYTGSGHLGSGMSMDKAITKHAMERIGIPTAQWCEVYYDAENIPELAQKLPVPCAVKVINGGSSIGVALPDTREELEKALRDILKYGNHVIVEEKISGREFSVGVLNEHYLPAVEIIPQNGSYFDYEAKYQAGGSLEICPADIPESLWHAMGEAALALHQTMRLSVYSRTDFIVREDGTFCCLEINTLPGLTSASLLPKEAKAIGLSYPDLCELLIYLSLEARKGENL